MSKLAHALLCLVVYSASALAVRHDDEAKKESSLSSRPSPSSLLQVFESTEPIAKFKKRLTEITSETAEEARNQKIESALNSGEWTCGKSGIESAVSELSDVFTKNESWKASFVSAVEASSAKRLQNYVGFATGDYSKARKASFVLAEIRGNGGVNTKTGVQGFRLIASEVSRFFDSTNASLASYFAEAALASGIDFGADAKSRLEKLLTEENKKQRMSALLSLAVSDDPEVRSLYRQIVLTLPKGLLTELTTWIQNHHIASEDPGECTALRLDTLLLKSPTREKALGAPETQALMAKRLVDDPDFPLADALSENESLQRALLPSLLKMSANHDPRLATIEAKLLPSIKTQFSALAPHLAAVGASRELVPLESFPLISEAPKRTGLTDIKDLADLMAHLQDPNWHCDSKGWSSARKNAHAKLVADEDLRTKFLALNAPLSKSEFSNVLWHYQAGRISIDELTQQLEAIQDKYYLTEEAFAAREILIALEPDPQLKRFLMVESEELGAKLQRPSSLEQISRTALVNSDFEALSNLSIIPKGGNGTRYRRILLELSSREAKAYATSMGMDSCEVMTFPEAFKDRLTGSNLSQKTDAIRRLGKSGKAAVPYLSQIIRTEKSTDDVRLTAILALDELGPEASESFPALVAALSDKYSATVRIMAANTLQGFRVYREEAVPVLLAGLREKEVRTQFAQALAAMGERALPQMISTLANMDYDDDAIQMVLHSIGLIGSTAGSAVPSIREHLKKSKKIPIRNSAVWALANIGPTAKDAVPELIAALDDKQLSKEAVIFALGRIGPSAEAAIPELAKTMTENLNYRGDAAVALAHIGEAALPHFAAALLGKDEDMVNNAFMALPAMGAPAIDLLVTILQSPEPENAKNLAMKWKASRALADIGSDAVPHLKKMLSYPNARTQEYAQRALDLIAEREAQKARRPFGSSR